jgi:hypothetical protein
MKKLSDLRERCWPGYKSVKGKKAYSPGSCVKEDLRKWFDKDHPEGGWKRINSKGDAIGPCAREPGEPKPKCMSNEKRAQLSKKERASAVATKRKHDPNPERKGGPINVSNFGKGKISENMENLEEKNVPTSPEKWAQAKSQAKAKFDVYPSAYANGWAAKKYKEMGGGWKSVSEDVNEQHADVGRFEPVKPHNVKNVAGTSPRRTSDSAIVKLKEQSDTSEKNEMAQTQLHFINYASKEILDYIGMGGEIEEWYQNKLSKVQSEVESLHSYIEGEKRRTGMVKEESEQIDELSKDTLNSYMGKAAKDNLTSLMKPGMIAKKHAAKRFIGMQKAGEKLTKEETIEEGRPSQRHPLEGHDYHKKTDAELVYIAKDAHKAAEAMKSHNTTAENKYRDQANDSATVRHFRKTSGMPEWYKKKYGHIKEEVELDEASDDIRSHRVGDEVILKNKDYHGVIVKSKGSDISFKNKSDNKHYKATHNMIDRNISQENRYKEKSDEWHKKIDDAMASDMKRIDKSGALKKFGIGVKEQVADAPFDPPYSKKPGSHTDKSGAVHGPMSTAKHLARMAAAKQARNLANPTAASKKSSIVREAMRDAKKRDEKNKEEKKVSKSGKDKFQPDPELNSQIIRTE